MSRLFRGELLKITSTRTVAGFAAAGVVLTVANVVIIAVASGTLDEVREKEEALSGLPVLLLLFGLVGAAGEYRHRTAVSAALVAGRGRGLLLLARTGAYAVAGLVVGGLMAGVSIGAGLPLLAGQPGPDLHVGEVARVAAGCLVAAVLATVIGVAGGALVRSQAVGVVGALLLSFVVTPLVGTVDESAADYTPLGAAGVLARMTHGPHHPSSGVAAVVMAAWAVSFLVVAILCERRRDLA